MTQALRVRDFMTTELHTVTPGTEIMFAVRRMVELDVSGLVVVDDNGSLVGLLTERDCIDVALQAGYFDEYGGSVNDFMTAPVTTIDPGTSMMDLAATFASAPFRRLPVVEAGKLVGLVCRRDVLRALTTGSWFSRPT